MNKVIITEKQARMIENHRNDFDLLMTKRVEDNCPTSLDDLSIETVARAYIEGYEILTPRLEAQRLYDSVAREWSEYLTDPHWHEDGSVKAKIRICEARMSALVDMAEIFGCKIKQVGE